MTDDHNDKLNQSMNLFTYPPVIDKIDKLTPFNDLENPNELCMMIWFEVDSSRFLSVSIDKRRKDELFDNFAMLPDFIVPAYDETCTDLSKNTPLSMHSRINFDVILTRCCLSIMLQCYIESRLG